MSQASVSVVIPSYNRTLGTMRAVASALAQGGAATEIVVVDDASTPPLDPASPGFADPRVRLVRLAANQGAASARQAGIDAASGNYVAFLDSDDLWLPGKFAAQLPLLSGPGAGMIAVACGWRERGEARDEATRVPLASSRPIDFASGCWYCPGSTVLIAKSAFARVGPFNPLLRRLEDLEWFLRFALEGGRLAVAPIIGAEIAKGRRASGAHVLAARGELERLFLAGGARLPQPMGRRLAAYLSLESALAHRNDGRLAAMALELAHSFGTCPRLTIPLERWWVAPDLRWEASVEPR